MGDHALNEHPDALERVVVMTEVDELPRCFDARIHAGYLYGDFQFATDMSPGSKGACKCQKPRRHLWLHDLGIEMLRSSGLLILGETTAMEERAQALLHTKSLTERRSRFAAEIDGMERALPAYEVNAAR